MASYGVPEFIADVRSIIADGGPSEQNLARVAEKMGQLVRNPEIQAGEATSNVHVSGGSGSGSGPMFHDEESGLTLMRARFGPEAMTPIHNHGSWGVVGVYRGRDCYQIWRRKDGTEVELVDERILEPGDTVVLPPPPQDIHAQQGHDGTTVHELVLFGANLRGKPRLYFDPEAKTAVEVMPGRG
jgi:predicted metal-dependent enzyme (double-stranded beta helix superfamily)